ncbi:hydrocephalus-inducing protein homolog isoform X2 [Monodelphis domestica]|uniref:hydrocephalus-inducing protein homolog isoform X2 n=1 Tax=Monodelphis domestica TaxID=13616 RepID=UPI0024E2361A|nr:hydrocephalus-inducing protein homolog isoform X2 [Monodelphis domestica]
MASSKLQGHMGQNKLVQMLKGFQGGRFLPPRLVSEEEANKMPSPSEFLKEMSLTTEERLSSTRVMCRPQITELLDMGETTHQKYSSIDLDQTLFQPFPSEIVFQNYAACEVYEVPLILRNNDKIPRLVKIVEESSPYFKVISPNDICNKVAPGVPSTFRILFTPEENKDYSHVLTCVTEREKFIVPIKARGARAILDFPDELNFGICPVKHKTEKVLLVRNIGNREAVFDIKVGSPFSAEPSVGTVNVGDTVQLSVDFEPLTLGDHSAKLIVNYDTGEKVAVSLYGAGADVNIRLDKNSLTIEKTYISLANQRNIIIHNRSNIIAYYQWKLYATQEEEDGKKSRLCEDLIIEEEKRMEQLLQECILDPSLREHLSVISHAFQNQRQRIMSNDMLFFGNIFVVEPVEGEIWPNSAAQISVTFYPREAILYQQTIYCEITGRETRLPLRIKGEGMGPKVVFNFDTLDIGKAFVGSTHCYETILSNKGSIDALFNLDPPTTPLGSCFIFNPKEGIVEPSGVQAIQISFRSSILGHFREEFLFSVNGSPEPVKLTIRGCVIGPTFHFNVPALDFGDVSYGFPRSLTCSLNNTSLIPMTFKLRVPGDGVGDPSITSVEQISDIRRPSWSNEWSTVIKPREFTIKPSSGSIRSQGFVAIRVTLCSNTVKKYQLALVVDVEGIGEEVLALLITGRCVVPKLRVVNQELNYGYCFLKYPYQQTVQLVNDDDLPGCYGVPLQEYEETPSVLFSSLNPCGIINPHSTIELILVLETQVLGEYHCTVQITTFGSKDPPLTVQLRSVGEGPVVNVYPDKIDFGSIYVLKETSRSLHLSNQSYITAFFSAHLVNKKSLWKILPEEGIVPPETEIVLTVTANLDDMLLFKDVIILSIQNSNNYHIPVQALGKGTTIVSDKPFAPELNLGAHFSVDPFFYNLKLTNKGRRYHQLYWMNEGFRHCQKQTRTSISNEVPMHQNVSQVVESEGPVFQVHPVRMELGPGQSTELVLEGFSDSPKVVKERLVCYAIIGGNVRKTQIMTVNVNCEFIAPIIQLSTKQILYHLEKEAQSELEPEFKPLTLKNVSSLPVRVILSTREPFYLCDVDKSILFQPCGPMEMAVGEEKKLLVKFDPFMRNDLNQWVAEEVLAIKYLEHPQVDQMSLRGEVHFPNLTFETMELDFGCILNDTEVIRYIQMVNCSPLMVKFRWSFLVDNKENQIRFVTGQRKPYTAPVRVWSQPMEPPQTELLPGAPEQAGASSSTPAIDTEEFVDQIIMNENNMNEEEKKLLTPSIPIKSSFEEVDREVLSQSQVEFQDNLWVFEPDDSLAIGVEEVFDILPLYGVLPPLSSHQVSFSFYGHCDIIAQVKALCEVEGGPTYEITLKGEASLVNYTFDTKEIHYGLQMFDQVMESEITLKNVGKVGFEFKIMDGYQNSAENPRPGVPLIMPRSGVIESKKEQILKVYYLPGVPEAFERNFQVQIAHLEPETITVTGEGIFPRICLDLPRNIKGNEKYEEFLREARKNLGKKISKDMLSVFPDPGTETTGSEEDFVLDVQLQMEIERLIIQNHALEQQKLFDLEDSFFSSRARRRLLKAQLPEYILDFGYIILGEILTHYVKITNTSNLPVSFQAEKGALHDTGFSVHLDRVKNLPFCESETCEVRCDPQAANVSVGSKEAILPIKVSGGPTLHICLRAKVTTPSLSLSHDKVEFGTIQCGQCQVVTIQLYNDLPVSCEWSIHNPRQVSKLDKRMPKYLRRKLLAELKPKRQAFDVLPVSGILHSGDRKNVQVKFMPSEEKFYSQCLTVNIAHSTQKLSLFVQGYGLEPRLDFSPSVLELGPLLPYAPGDEAEVIVKNPCDFPIEFYSLEFDQEYLLEEKILRNLKGYDACNTILLPPRAPGEKLPPEVHEYYKELVRFREEQKNKAGEFQIPDNAEEEGSHSTEQGTWSSTKRISLSQGVSASSNMEERHGLDIRHYQEEEEEEDNLDRFFSHVGEKTQSASDSRSVEEVGEIDHNPVSRSIARHLGISTSPESHTANKHQRGIAIMVHGAPVSGKTAVANSLAKYYGAVCLTLDSIVLDALSDSNSVPGIRARELCMRATMEQSIRDGEESVKEAGMNTESSLAQTSIGLSRISNENLAKHTSEATLVSPETRNFTKGNRGSGQTNKTKSDSHGSGSQKQHHQMHQSETSGSQVPSSPLTYTPIQLRIMGSTSEGDMGFFSCVLPEDLFVQIIEERLQLSDCYRGVVFDGIESVFARNAVSSLQCLLRAINNREHIYFINLSQDYTVMKAREKAKQEQEEQERLETIAKEKARLQKMDEEEYDALTEEEKNMFDREVLEAMRERKKRKQEKLARELQEKRLQQELERQREEEEMKKKTKKKREPTKEELTGKKNMPKQSINAKGEVKSELWLDRKVSMVKDHLTEEKKEEKRRKSKQLLGETLPLQPLVEHEESEKDLLRESEKHVIHRFKIYEMNLKDIQQILMFWDRKQGVWVPHAGTEEIHHDTEDQRQAPTVRKGRKDREKERLEKLEKEKAERERLEKEKAEKERLEKLKTTEDRSDVLEVEEEDHEGKKEFGVPILEFQPSISEEFTCKQVLESERLPKIEQMVDILDVTVVELPIPPPALFSIIQFPAKRVPVITTEILKHFTFVVPPSEETSTTEEKKENESESDIFTGTLTPKEEQPTPSRRQRKDKDGGPVKEKRGRGTPITKKIPQVLPSGNITPLATLDESTFTTTQIQDKFVRLSNFRWIVPAHGEVTLRVHFSSNETGNFDQTFNFEILGTRRQYQLYCRGVCTYPSICRDPRVVFPHRKKDWKPDETVFKKYVINQDTFHFGPLLCGKSRDRYKAVQFPDNMEKLTILNNSPLTSEVTFLFQHDVKANTYILDPPFMILKPNEKQVLSVWAYPTAVGLFDDSIVCCIKENPEPAVFKITCQGIRPELELDHKQLHFEKLLLHRKESKIIFLKNVTPLPVAWRISSLEHLGDDFSVSKTQGVIYPGSEYCLQIHFQPTKAVNIKKAIRLEILDADYLIGVVQIENIQIFAESYDIALDITFPKGNEGFLDFGVVRVMEEVKQFLALKNKGKYEITYSFILEPLPANLPKVNSIISTQPKRGTLTTTERPTNIQVTFRSKREIRIDSKPILRCQIIEPNSLEGGEVIASIPIKFSVNAVFSKYAISPASVINFGALVCGSRKTSSFNIENQGVLDFKFSISRLNRDAPLLHGRKIGGHPKHARSKENVSFFRFSTTRTVKGNESLQKELSSMNQARFTLNMFTIYPGFGSIPPGGQQSITVDCIADPVGRCEEYLAIEISDRDPKDQPNGIQYTLIAEACFPAFVTDDVASIFEEHLICKNINQYQFLQAVESRGVFFEDENKFMFRNVLVGHQGKARFKINNVGKIPCDVSFSVKPTSVKSMFRISDIFEVEPNKMCISSHSQAFATVTFTPPTMQTFQCVFEASLDGLPNFLSKTRNLSFDIVGEGNLPRVMIIRPVLYNQKGNPLFLFKRLLVGQSEKLPLILKNNGTIPAQLLIDLRDSTQTFSLKGRPSTKYIYIIEENSPTEIAKKAHTASLIIYPGETGELDVQFQPDKPERMTGTIRLTVINNQYEETIFQMIGESYEDDITLDNIHGLVNSKSDMEEIIEFTDDKMMEEFLSASRMAHLQFGDCHIDQTYEVTFTMTNRSKKIVVKFEWAAMNSLQFSPQVGHLHAGCAKDIKVTLKSSSPTAFKKTLIKCKISRIKFQQPADQVSDWDDHMRTVKWVDAVRNPNTAISPKKKVIETDPEPVHVVVDENYQELDLLVSAVVDFASFLSQVKEVAFKDTLVFQTRIFEFDLINIGPVQLEYNWLLSPDEPTKAVSFADQESSNAPSKTASLIEPSRKEVASKGSAIESASSHAYSGAYTYPFSMEPVSGVIPADKRQTFKVKFSPLEVGEFENNLCCQIPNLFPGDQNLILTVKGRSLLPFCHFDLKESDYISNHKRNPDLSGPRGGPLDPSTRVIEFDAMGVGAKNIQTFTITNPTSDTYSYRWTSEDIESLQNPPTFTCLTQGGTIHPEKKAEISFLFIPHTLDIIESFWTFSIPEHNISVPFLLVGKAIDPLLSLTPSYLTFSSILIGHEAREMAYIINNEDQDFSFAFEEGSCFSEGYINNLVVKPMQGIVPAKSRVPIEIFFTPKSQGQVNFNLICHVKRKAQFLTLNVKAEGYSTKVEIRCKESDGSVINLNPNGPNIISFYEVEVNECVQCEFTLINTGKFSFNVLSEIGGPKSLQQFFTFSPSETMVEAGQGVSATLSFQPEKKCFVKDVELRLKVTHGPTFVCVITGTAVTPAIQFSFYSFNFGTCFIYSPGMPLYQQMLVITNNEEKPISLDCLYTNTAQLEVSCGVDVIKPRNHLEVPITFYPREAIAYNEIIPFEINGLSKVNVEIQGKGTEMKVSVLDPENKIVKLGAILPKHMVKKYATIINNSLIPLTFNLTTTFSVPELTDPKILTLTPCTNITLKPQEVCKVEIVFSPMKRIPHFNEEVLLEFTGLLRSLFLLNGCCQALEINLDQDHIPFGAVVFQAQATRRLLMINTGDIGARFHWHVKKFAPNFSIQPDKGYITPGMEVAFEVTYHPTEIGKDSLYKNLPCSVQGRKPLLLTLSGACVNVAGIKETVNFSCQVRSRHVQTIMLSNRTNRTWHLRPIFEGEHWEGPEYFVLEAHQQNRPYEITYRPLTMNVDGRKHLGTLFFPLPDGTGLFYVLQGTAEAPKAITNIFREVPSKTPYVELLPVENWLNKLQRFRATVDMIKPEKQDLSVTIKGLDYIDVLAGSKKDYKLNFFSYKEGLFSAKVTFRNEVTNEYMFYLLTFKVLSSGIIKTIELSTFVRQSTSASIKLENPLPYTITFNTDCRVPDISVPSQFSIPSNSEGTLTFEFQPLKVGETTGRLNLHQSDLGTFQYELSLKANPALPEKPIYFQTPLGSSQPLNAKFINYTRQKTEYSCKTDSLDFHVEKVVPAPAGGQSGTEVSVEIIFEPSQLGEVRGMLYLSSAIGGEYTFPLIGLAQYPKPQGPIQIKAGFSATIPFKNIFHHSMAFSFIVESPAFSVKNVETVRAKKVHNISVTFDGNPSGNKTPVTTKLIVSGLHATGNEAGIKWIYYLKGITL